MAVNKQNKINTIHINCFFSCYFPHFVLGGGYINLDFQLIIYSEKITVENEIEKAKDKNYYKNSNYWWDEKLTKLHRLKCEAYKSSNTQNNLKQNTWKLK